MQNTTENEEQGFQLPKRIPSKLAFGTLWAAFHVLGPYYAAYYGIKGQLADQDKRTADVEKRLSIVESNYVPASVHAIKDTALQIQLSDMKENERRTGEDVREIRRLIESRR